jgi:hypothetical protein
MSKCVKCNKFLHPDLCVVIDEDSGACKCVFCYTDKKTITVEDEETGKMEYQLSKEDAVENYRIYTLDLMNSEKVAKVLAGTSKLPPKQKTQK